MAVAISVIGSPSHGRGKDHLVPQLHQVVGITPAWAGKSEATGWTTISRRDHPRAGGKRAGGAMKSPRNRDHPRVGGEKRHLLALLLILPGSPPRRRGKGGKSFTGNMFTGITPAWAGKRRGMPRREGRGQDHPRVGGEKVARCLLSRRKRGSPPHGRGKARHLSHGLLPCG